MDTTSFLATGTYKACVTAVAIPAPTMLIYEAMVFVDETRPLISEPKFRIINDGKIKPDIKLAIWGRALARIFLKSFFMKRNITFGFEMIKNCTVYHI